MSKSYVIQWKSTINGRTGRGTRVFEFDEAQRLAEELNQEYPDIDHSPAEVATHSQAAPSIQQAPPVQQPRPVEPEPTDSPEAAEDGPQITRDPNPEFSFQ